MLKPSTTLPQVHRWALGAEQHGQAISIAYVLGLAAVHAMAEHRTGKPVNPYDRISREASDFDGGVIFGVALQLADADPAFAAEIANRMAFLRKGER